MSTKFFTALSAAVLGVAALGQSAPAQAGDVSNAQLSCYVDTYAYDYATIGECTGVWTPGTANNPSQAVFQVVGLTAGSFTSIGPLLAGEPMLADRWSARLDLGRGRPAIGLVWGGGLGLADLTPLAGIGDLRFVALERVPSAMLARSSAPSG